MADIYFSPSALIWVNTKFAFWQIKGENCSKFPSGYKCKKA